MEPPPSRPPPGSRSQREAEAVSKLRQEDMKLWGPFRCEPVSDQTEEMCCGWKRIRPSAEYDLTAKTARSKRKKAAPAAPPELAATSSLSLVSQDGENAAKCPYMSGELDETFSYIYKGGLSNRAENRNTGTESVQKNLSTQSLSQKHIQTVTLMPSQPTGAQALANCRAELSRILALQLKPEILVEQLIIENRLRTMSLAAFPVLEDIGAGGGRSDKMYSHSTPALGTLPNTHVNYQSLTRHKRQRRHHQSSKECYPSDNLAKWEAAKPHLQWCSSLSSHKSSSLQLTDTGASGQNTGMSPPQLSHHPSALHLHLHKRSSGMLHQKSKKNIRNSSDPTFADVGSTEPAAHYRLPVVAPSLPSGAASGGGSKSNRRLNSLLYQPDKRTSSNSRHKSTTLTTGSSFYYPHVSYSNSKPMNLK